LRGQYPDTVDRRITKITGKKGGGCESPLPFLSSRSDHEPSPISGVKRFSSESRTLLYDHEGQSMSVFFFDEEGRCHFYLLPNDTPLPMFDPVFACINSFQEKHT